MVRALIAGERDLAVLADMAKSRMRSKIDALALALDGNFHAHHGVVAQRAMHHIAFLEQAIAGLSSQIAERLVEFQPAITLLTQIPGWGRLTAEVFIAETGGRHDRVPYRRASRLMGGCRARHARICRQTTTGRHRDRQRLAWPRAHRSRARGGTHPEHLCGRPVPTPRGTTRAPTSHDRRRPHHGRGRLAHARHRRDLPRTGWRLFRTPGRATTASAPPRAPTRTLGYQVAIRPVA